MDKVKLSGHIWLLIKINLGLELLKLSSAYSETQHCDHDQIEKSMVGMVCINPSLEIHFGIGQHTLTHFQASAPTIRNECVRVDSALNKSMPILQLPKYAKLQLDFGT